MRVAFDPAFVLRAAPYSDTSLLVEAFSRNRGRVGLVARGARGAKSKSRGLLQPFRPVLLSWTESGDLGSLTAIEADGVAVPLTGEQVFSGWYLNELLLRMVQRHDPHPALFDAYVAALGGLPLALERALRLFEKRLLAELGFGLDLPDDLDPERYYRFDPESGALPWHGPADGEDDVVSGGSLIALRDETFETPDDLRAARRVLRRALEPQLGGREIVTARVLRELRRL